MLAYNKETGKLYFKTITGFIVNFDIRSPITQLVGDSATGKSFILNIISEYKKSEEANSIDSLYTFSNVEVINRKKDLDLIGKKGSDLIIIDRGDYLLERGNIENILASEKETSYLIIGRGLSELNLTPNYIAELQEHNKEFKLSYRFSVKGWW